MKNLNDLNRNGVAACIAEGIACDIVMDDETRKRIARRIERGTGERPEAVGLSPEQRLAVDRAVDSALTRRSMERQREAADVVARAFPNLPRRA